MECCAFGTQNNQLGSIAFHLRESRTQAAGILLRSIFCPRSSDRPWEQLARDLVSLASSLRVANLRTVGKQKWMHRRRQISTQKRPILSESRPLAEKSLFLTHRRHPCLLTLRRGPGAIVLTGDPITVHAELSSFFADNLPSELPPHFLADFEAEVNSRCIGKEHTLNRRENRGDYNKIKKHKGAREKRRQEKSRQ